ncbi:MAG TPA: LysR family transcriptional regulator [Vicinamibacterales bacterium]|nr:LysR family transcriptional regulator [Vicinamibacterales bacterium]
MKRLDLDQVASFVALVEAGSFGGAARRLGLSQSTVSQHLKRLETQLAVRLIERARTGSVPTGAAHDLLPLARSLLRVDRRARETVSQATLSLGACSNLGVYIVPELLRDFSAAGGSPPALAIGDNPCVAAWLEAAEIDVAFMEWWDERPGFCSEIWRSESVVAIAPAGHSWGALDAVPLDELTGARLIGGEPGTGTGRLIREHLDPMVALPRPVLELGSTEAVKRAVAAGLGVSIVLGLTVVREARNHDLVVRPLDPALAKRLHVVRRDDVAVSHPFVEFLRTASAATTSK